jgi:hypothetical protein
MFDQFFARPCAVIHHKAAPYAAERERFLERESSGHPRLGF